MSVENVGDFYSSGGKIEDLDTLDSQGKSLKVSPTAIVVDSWSVRVAKEMLRESSSLRERLGLPKDNPSRLFGYQQHEQQVFDSQASDLSEFFTAAFESEVEFTENTAKPDLQEYMKELVNSPSYETLRRSTFLDVGASMSASEELGKTYYEYAKAKAEAEGQDGGLPGSGQGQGNGPSAGDAAKQGIKNAKQKVQQDQDAADALGIGKGNGVSQSISNKKALDIFAKVRNSSTLQKICQAAGRWRDHARAIQKQKSVHGYDTLVGCTIGGEIERLLPQELSALAAGDDLELLVMKKLIEREASIRQYEGWEPKAKGPIVVLVDESGSMTYDNRIIQAKAMALAMAWVARQQGRWCCLVSFSGNKDYTMHVCKPGENDPDGLCKWLQHFYNGGTTPEVLCDSLPKDWSTKIGAPKGKTDILMITDGQMELYAADAVRFESWKEQESVKLSIIGIGIGQSKDRSAKEMIGSIGKVADSVFSTDTLDIGSNGVDEALAV